MIICNSCGIKKDESEFHRIRNTIRHKCKSCVSEYNRIKHLDPIFGAKNRARSLKVHDRLRIEMIGAYGGKCAGFPSGYICNEERPEALCIDHINDDGYKATKNERKQMTCKLKREGWPKDNYQLLCASCNLVKRAKFARQNILKPVEIIKA
jgi:hypothetical protein